jgi:peptide/nickel transport system ATP-binding protein
MTDRAVTGRATSEPMLSIENLTVTHESGGRDQVLVRDVSLQLGRGESLGLVGESGSGKSLTAKSIVSLLPSGLRASGTMLLGGVTIDPTEADGAHRGSNVALLMQDPFTMLNPMMTSGAHIAETLRAAGVPRRDVSAEVARRLAEVGITDANVAGRYPFELSGGMSQRVAMAAALANDPQILVADEPTTALDATTQHEVLQLLRNIQLRRGMGLILITHDLRLAFSVCDRVMVMYAGSIVETSPSDLMSDAPIHPYTEGLLSSVPSVEHFQHRLVGIAGSVPAADTVLDRCAFAERCGHRRDVCVQARPQLMEVEPGRWSSCVRHGELDERPDDVSTASARTVATPHERVVVRVDDVSKTYGSGRTAHVALNGVSFELGDGESLGIVGESGSGKTTIARCLLGLTAPSSGTLWLDGIDVTIRKDLDRAQRQAAAQRLQCVFQDPYSTLNPMHSVGYTIGEALAHRGRPVHDREAEIARLLERVGLAAELARRRPSALSGGQRQRVAIARALAVEPRVLVCDEPVAALDVSVQAQVLELLRELHRREGTSLLFITHDLGVVRQITDRVLVLLHGEVVEEGPTDTVLDAPQHEYTRRLVASMPRLGDGWLESVPT